MRIFRKLAQLLDVDTSGVADGDALTYDAGSSTWVPGAGGGGGGAPTDVNYLVGTASGDLSAEIAVGTTPGGELGGTWASPTVDATHSGSSHATVQAAAEATAAAALSSHASDTTGIHGIADTSALATTAASDAAYQPKDSDLTAIAALTTTSFGRGLLALADQAALLSAAGASAASHVHAGEDITSGTVADARIASTIARDSEVTSAISALSTVYQPLDSDLTAIAALTTTSYGRSLLALADAAALRTSAGLVIGTDVEAHDTDLTTIAGLSPSNDDVLQRKAGAWANRTIAQLLTDLAAAGTTFQPLDSDLTAFAGLSIAADKLPYGTGSHTLGLTDLSSFIRTVLDDADAATARATLGVIASLFQSGGAQAIKLDDLATPDDNTDLDVSTSRHGLMSKLPGGTTTFYRADGTFAAAGGGGTRNVPIDIHTPRSSSLAGNAFWTVLGLTDYDAGHWEFVKDVDGKVYGHVRIPHDYSSGGTLRIEIAANATSGVTRWQVGTKAVADGESLNPSALTDETAQDITVPGTAYLRKQVSFTLTETLAADDLLVVELFHAGAHANDTVAVNTLLFEATLEYTA